MNSCVFLGIILLLFPALAVPESPESIVIYGGTIIDGTGRSPIKNSLLVIQDKKIQSIENISGFEWPENIRLVDATNKYIIPGLMDANVHLFLDFSIENLARYEGRYTSLITEAAQVALKHGVTTVFDTWGPLESLLVVRDRINAGVIPGSRIFVAGNVVGYGGPISTDHGPLYIHNNVVSEDFKQRINQQWEVGVGPELRWLPKSEVSARVEAYASKGIDFIKFGGNGVSHSTSAFFNFSPAIQREIVDIAHRNGLMVQSHTSTVEGLRVAIESGVDLLQHCDSSGEVAIPQETLRLLARKKIPCATLSRTQTRRDQLAMYAGGEAKAYFRAMAIRDKNTRNMIALGVNILLSTDASIFGVDAETHPLFSYYAGEQQDALLQLGQGHISWLKAMIEKGHKPMDALMSATSNIANAYGLGERLGTLEEGKVADLLILNSNPLKSVEAYQDIYLIFKNGKRVDRTDLPQQPLLTRRGHSSVNLRDNI